MPSGLLWLRRVWASVWGSQARGSASGGDATLTGDDRDGDDEQDDSDHCEHDHVAHGAPADQAGPLSDPEEPHEREHDGGD
jgi:hypothetical protein